MITITKKHLTKDEVERCELAYAAGVSPQLVRVDLTTGEMTFERCEPIDDLTPYYDEIFELLLKAVRYDRRLAHADPGFNAPGDNGYNVMLLRGKVVFIDWETVAEDDGRVSSDVRALNTFLGHWSKTFSYKRYSISPTPCVANRAERIRGIKDQVRFELRERMEARTRSYLS